MDSELEDEQLDYIRRNSDKTMHIPKENQDYPNILKEPLVNFLIYLQNLLLR
jgi:hypothetical protein